MKKQAKKAVDGRVTAHDNEMRVLRALHRFGWLRTRDIAALLWSPWQKATPRDAPTLSARKATSSGLRMAQKTLKRMHLNWLLLKGSGPDGSVLYALAEAGVRALSGSGVSGAASGKDLIRSFSAAHFRHRCIANEIAISGVVQGFKVSTEREISQGRWPWGKDGVAGKLPDVLLRSGRQLWWVEVERSRKNARDYTNLISWLVKVLEVAQRSGGSPLINDYVWTRIVFVCTPAFEMRLRADLERAGFSKDGVDMVVIFEKYLYEMKAISFW